MLQFRLKFREINKHANFTYLPNAKQQLSTQKLLLV